jgi:hypothetical protein
MLFRKPVNAVRSDGKGDELYFLIPREVSANSATLWIAAVDEPRVTAQLLLEPQELGVQILGPWQRWPPDAAGKTRVEYRGVVVSGLGLRKEYPVTLQLNGTAVASAKFTTLPAEMPILGEKPFTVLLGSCFAYREDSDHKLGNAFFHMPHLARPDLKIFAGDQVYLDSPWHRYLIAHTPHELRQAFLEQYVGTWSQEEGFSRLLTEGANYCSSDDHEFWNNAPNPAAYVIDTWDAAGRQYWREVAGELYSVFQSTKAIAQFAVPPVSFLVADTRLNRDEDRKNFMKPRDLDQVADWIKGLKGPGVLTIGQPLLQTTTGFFKGHFGDWNLPDFEQYQRLVEIVGGSRQTLVVLTGDVHYGRIARSSLRSGGELIEIISSPMSLVDEKARGKWEAAPVTFPTTAPSQLARSEVVTEGTFATTDGHFLTLEFTRRGPTGVRLRVRFWPVFKAGISPPNFGKTIWERVLSESGGR